VFGVTRPGQRPEGADDAELVAKGGMGLKCGIGLPAEDKEVEQEADD